MKCLRCQAENVDGARFCEDGGAGLERQCPKCSQAVSGGKKFCRSCWATLTPESQSDRSAAPGSYTPKHLAEKILTSKSALESERKQVTVLFADLKGHRHTTARRAMTEKGFYIIYAQETYHVSGRRHPL